MAYQWLVSSGVKDMESVLICNDDTSFDNTYVERGIRRLHENPHTLVVGTGYGLYGKERLDGLFFHSYKDGTGRLLGEGEEGNCASTRSLFLKAGDWKKIGGFHPMLLPHYASDFEFTIRASRKGFRLCSFTDLTYVFDEGTTGDNEYEKLTLKKLFSKRSNSNPFYKLSFILLSTPIRYLPSHVFYQLGRFARKAGIFLKIAKRR